MNSTQYILSGCFDCCDGPWYACPQSLQIVFALIAGIIILIIYIYGRIKFGHIKQIGDDKE